MCRREDCELSGNKAKICNSIVLLRHLSDAWFNSQVDFELKLNPVYNDPLAANAETMVRLKHLFQNIITPNKYSHGKGESSCGDHEEKNEADEICAFIALIKCALLFLFT